MSLGGGYNKSTFRAKRERESTDESDFLSARLRRSYGSHGHHQASKLAAKDDAPVNSKFHRGAA
jgi:hypothetical protein